MAVLLFAQYLIWFPYLPNQVGRMSVDFSFYLPNLLAGYFWFLRNGAAALPWFSPAECAGSPFYADPQSLYLSPIQLLGFVMPPVDAVRAGFVVYSLAGFWGMRHLARHVFRLSPSACLLAAGLFMMNNFFAVRMVVGHLTFAPFMLLPAFAACVIAPGVPRAEIVWRSCVAGVLLAICIQGGMVHLLGPFYLATVALWLIHRVRFPGETLSWLPLLGATCVGLALCAAKLDASLALMSHFPRDDYTLPGVPGILATFYIAMRALFTPASDALGGWVVNQPVLQEQHEFEYGVSVVPLLLLVGLLIHAAGTRRWPQGWRAGLVLCALLLLPVALNVYSPGWNAVLKGMPVLGSSSNLLRWFAAYIPVAILAAGIAADELCHAWRLPPARLAAGGISVMLLTLGLSDHRKYGPLGLGFYDASGLQASWHAANETGQVPAIDRVVDYRPNGQPSLQPERQNGLVAGASMLPCYQPVFGYRLEKLPFGSIRLDHALSVRDGVFNFKNPACYVFPGANSCKPGDPFPQASEAALRSFLDYRPLPFARPWSAHLAWLVSAASVVAVPILLLWSVLQSRCLRHGRANPADAEFSTVISPPFSRGGT